MKTKHTFSQSWRNKCLGGDCDTWVSERPAFAWAFCSSTNMFCMLKFYRFLWSKLHTSARGLSFETRQCMGQPLELQNVGLPNVADDFRNKWWCMMNLKRLKHENCAIFQIAGCFIVVYCWCFKLWLRLRGTFQR